MPRLAIRARPARRVSGSTRRERLANLVLLVIRRQLLQAELTHGLQHGETRFTTVSLDPSQQVVIDERGDEIEDGGGRCGSRGVAALPGGGLTA